MKLYAVNGSFFTTVQVGAIVLPINPWGQIFPQGIEIMLEMKGGKSYLERARHLLSSGSFREGSVITLKRQSDHEGTFDNVLFLITDDGNWSVDDMAYFVLSAADAYSIKSVAFPVFPFITNINDLEWVDGIINGCIRYQENNRSGPDVFICSFGKPDQMKWLVEKVKSFK